MSKQTRADAPDISSLDTIVSQILHLAKTAGAEQAEAILVTSRNLAIGVREGEVEEVESSETSDLGLRVLFGQRQSCVSSSDLSPAGLEKMAERACAMARLAPEDPFCALADPDQVHKASKDFQVFDPTEVDVQALTQQAKEAERAALSVPGINLPATANASWSSNAICHRASNGLFRARTNTFHSQSVLALAERNGSMERDWAQNGACWLEDLRSPEDIGIEAAKRTIARLGATKGQGGVMAVLFEPRTAKTFLNILLGAISGNSVARGVSFLKDKMNEQVFAKNLTIIEDPHRLRGSSSSEVDSEGFARKPQNLVENGYLRTWLHNLSSARQLGQKPTGHAATALGSPPGIRPSNVIIAPGDKTPEQLMKQAGSGLVVTDAFGASFNNGTGDWSVGIAGFYFKDDGRTSPFSEMTVAGNMLDIFKILQPADDLKLEQSVETPSLMVPELAVAGQ